MHLLWNRTQKQKTAADLSSVAQINGKSKAFSVFLKQVTKISDPVAANPFPGTSKSPGSGLNFRAVVVWPNPCPTLSETFFPVVFLDV